MSSTLQIKRSLTANTPNTLAPGELAYSYPSQSLFIGDSNSNVITLLTGSQVELANTINLAYNEANTAYALAVNALPTTGGSISGSLNVAHDVVVTGNLTILGNTTTINSVSLLIDENTIYLSANNVGTPVLNNYITVVRGNEANTFLVWDENVQKWGWTDDGANVRFFTDTYNLANTANGLAQVAYTLANTANVIAATAYALAANALPTTGGTITGSLAVSQDITVNGNVTMTIDGGTF